MWSNIEDYLGSLLASSGLSQECCETFYKTQDSHPTKDYPTSNIPSFQVGILCIEITLHKSKWNGIGFFHQIKKSVLTFTLQMNYLKIRWIKIINLLYLLTNEQRVLKEILKGKKIIGS
jgi:hypothetical protein